MAEEVIKDDTDKVEEITEDMDLDLIEKANAAAVRLEKASEKFEVLLAKQQKWETEKILSGKVKVEKPEPKVETAEEYAQKVLRNEI